MRLRLLFPALGLLFASLAARADTMTYNFTYNGTGTFGSSDTGTGSFSYTYTPGKLLGSLSAFTFTDRLNSVSSSSTFIYDLAQVSSSAIVLTSTGKIASLSLATVFVGGSESSFGTANFVLQDSGVIAGVTAGGNPFARNFLSDLSAGSGTVTLSPALSPTPEPSSLALFGTGLLGVAGVIRKRFV